MTDIFRPDRLDRIKERMATYVNAGRSAGIEWRIGTVEKTLNKGACGAVSQDAIWRIYSMTKPLVSIAAMQMIEECRLPLHGRIARWLPEFKTPVVLTPSGHREPAREPINVLHLLSHMSGLSYGFQGDGVGREYAAAGVLADDTVSLRDQARLIASMPLAEHPGTNWRYSVSTDVLAALMEVIEEKSIGEILKARIFDPLGMHNTGFHVPQDRQPAIVDIRGTPLPPDFPRVPPLGIHAAYPFDQTAFGRGGHGVFSTLEDYCQFAADLLRIAQGGGHGLVSPRGLTAMTTNQVPQDALPMVTNLPFDSESPGFGGFGFGMGFSVDRGAMGRRLLGSANCFGWAGAADTWFTVDPVAGFYAVFMAQDLDRSGATTDFQTLLHAAANQ